jgi:hypothetical protein
MSAGADVPSKSVPSPTETGTHVRGQDGALGGGHESAIAPQLAEATATPITTGPGHMFGASDKVRAHKPIAHTT